MSAQDILVCLTSLAIFGQWTVRLGPRHTEFEGSKLAWSPDGSKIVFYGGRDDNRDIYVMNADGSNPTRLTNDPAQDRYPTWSPDGLRIAFTSNRDGDDEIYVMSADGTGLVRFTRSPGLDVLDDWRR
jgi:Tol biopolymer transport system component